MNKRIGKQIAEAQKKDLKGLQMSEWDRQNIETLIRFYELAFPGTIRQVAEESRADMIDETKFHKNDDKFKMSRRMAIPTGLLMELKRGYPAIISDKRQFEQFLKWFPQFDLWVRK